MSDNLPVTPKVTADFFLRVKNSSKNIVTIKRIYRKEIRFQYGYVFINHNDNLAVIDLKINANFLRKK